MTEKLPKSSFEQLYIAFGYSPGGLFINGVLYIDKQNVNMVTAPSIVETLNSNSSELIGGVTKVVLR